MLTSESDGPQSKKRREQSDIHTNRQTDRNAYRKIDGKIISTGPHWGPLVPSLGDNQDILDNRKI